MEAKVKLFINTFSYNNLFQAAQGGVSSSSPLHNNPMR